VAVVEVDRRNVLDVIIGGSAYMQAGVNVINQKTFLQKMEKKCVIMTQNAEIYVQHMCTHNVGLRENLHLSMMCNENGYIILYPSM
jgi:hypothetical protein